MFKFFLKFFLLLLVVSGLCWWVLRPQGAPQVARTPAEPMVVQTEPEVVKPEEAGEIPVEGTSVVKPGEKLLKVVTSGYVAYSLAKQIGGDKVKVSMLLTPGTEPHSFEPTPGSIIAVNSSDIFIYISSKLEPWVKDVLAGAAPSATVLEAGEFGQSWTDPHVWMNLDGALQLVDAIAAAFEVKDPASAAYFQANRARFSEEISALKHDYIISLANCKNKTLVHTGHLAFGNLAHAYGLDLRALSGASHQGEPSAKEMADLVKLIKEEQIKTIFTEKILSQNFVNTLAKETGAQVLALYTMEDASKADFRNNKTYNEFMRLNLASISEGLQCAAQ